MRKMQFGRETSWVYPRFNILRVGTELGIPQIQYFTSRRVGNELGIPQIQYFTSRRVGSRVGYILKQLVDSIFYFIFYIYKQTNLVNNK
jgi:hypothetical protein